MRYFADTFADSSYVHPSETDGTTDGVSAKVSALTECRGGETIYLLYFILRETKNTSSFFYLISSLSSYILWNLAFYFLRDKNR